MEANTKKALSIKMMGMATLAILFSFICFNAPAKSSASIRKDLVIKELLIQESSSILYAHPYYKKTKDVSQHSGNAIFAGKSTALLCNRIKNLVTLHLLHAKKTTLTFKAPSKFAQHKILSPDGEEDAVSE